MAMWSPVHPGELIKENMDALGWSVADCAENLGVSCDTVAALLEGRGRVSLGLGWALERVGWSTVEFWLRVQSSYDLEAERRRHSPKVSPTALLELLRRACGMFATHASSTDRSHVPH